MKPVSHKVQCSCRLEPGGLVRKCKGKVPLWEVWKSTRKGLDLSFLNCVETLRFPCARWLWEWMTRPTYSRCPLLSFFMHLPLCHSLYVPAGISIKWHNLNFSERFLVHNVIEVKVQRFPMHSLPPHIYSLHEDHRYYKNGSLLLRLNLHLHFLITQSP